MTKAFQPIADADWPARVSDLRDGFAGRLNVYRTMAHHPALLRAWTNLRQHVVQASALAPEDSEIVILRTGHRLGIPYELAHHVSRARKLGLSDARIASIAKSPAEMTAQDALLVQAVDDLIDRTGLQAATLLILEKTLGKHAVLDVIATVGFYTTLGYVLKSFDVPLDNDVARELEETPIG